jgi:hypothetical protein
MDNIEPAALLRQQINRFVVLPDTDWQLLLPHLQEKQLRNFLQQKAEKQKRLHLYWKVISASFIRRSEKKKRRISILRTTLCRLISVVLLHSLRSLPLKH